MTLSISHVIVHELVKHKNVSLDPNAQVFRDSELAPTSPNVTLLVEKIDEAYGNQENRCDYGVFLGNNRQGSFPPAVERYLNGQISFIDLSRVMMAELIKEAAKADLSTGGYIVFSEYSNYGKDFFAVVMIKRNSEITFDASLSPQSVTALNLRKLHQAVRINRGKLQNAIQQRDQGQTYEGTYLSFFGDVQRGAAGYFFTAAGCEKGSTSKQATAAVYSFLDKHLTENPVLWSKRLEARNAVTRLFERAIEARTPVSVDEIANALRLELSAHFGDDVRAREDFFGTLPSLMNSDEFSIPAEFNADKATTRSNQQVKYKSKSMQLTIDTKAISVNNAASEVYWEATKGHLIIKADARLRQEIQSKLNG